MKPSKDNKKGTEAKSRRNGGKGRKGRFHRPDVKMPTFVCKLIFAAFILRHVARANAEVLGTPMGLSQIPPVMSAPMPIPPPMPVAMHMPMPMPMAMSVVGGSKMAVVAGGTGGLPPAHSSHPFWSHFGSDKQGGDACWDIGG